MGDKANSKPIVDGQNVLQNERDESDLRNPQLGGQHSNLPHANYPYVNQYSHSQQSARGMQESFNMSALGGALPNYPDYSNSGPSRYPPGSSLTLSYPPQNVQQFSGSPITHSGGNSPYSSAYSPHVQSQYTPNHIPSPLNLSAGVNPVGHFYGQQGYLGPIHQQGQQFLMHPNQYVQQQSPMYAGMSGSGQFGGRANFAGDPRLQAHRAGEYNMQSQASGFPPRAGSVASSTGPPSVVRGPPRKPRQSGHAIWIGNLPPQTDLMSLVLHVCKETTGLESLFLISKSNCAFANFKDEAACTNAQSKIHDSRFQTIRLVSRLRRNSVSTSSGITVPSGPAASAALESQASPVIARSPSLEQQAESKPITTSETMQQDEDNTSSKDKFFVVKSLTVEDLELSVRNGIWATQSHNEDALNKAYQTADNVYLVFSANKSGEYFGYAKMTSPINNDPAAAIEFAPKAQIVQDPELPKAIPTPATEFAPKGRIIDDSARGTIFWEVEREESDEVDDEDEDGSQAERSESEGNSPSKAWGKPFKVEWISTTRLPFYRTRGLRNPWNSNREVKIARDGTELETAIGRRLVGLFHKLPSPVAPQHMPNMPLSVIGGYPQMRPFE